jgi:hypothetical protein
LAFHVVYRSGDYFLASARFPEYQHRVPRLTHPLDELMHLAHRR